MKRRIVITIAIATLGFTACIIGPKQDDPADLAKEDEGPDTGIDVGTIADTGGFTASDTSAADTALPPTPGDAVADAPSGDGKNDAADIGDADCGEVADACRD